MSIQSNSTKILHFLNSKGTGNYCSGQEIESNTGLSPDDINDAIEILESDGYVNLFKIFSATPYRFIEASITPHGRLELEKRQKNQNHTKFDKLKTNILFSWWKQAPKWIFGILGAVIAGIIVWWVTEGRHDPEKINHKNKVVSAYDSTASIPNKDSILQKNPSVKDTSLSQKDTITKNKKTDKIKQLETKEIDIPSTKPRQISLSNKAINLIEINNTVWGVKKKVEGQLFPKTEKNKLLVEIYNGSEKYGIKELIINITHDKYVKGSKKEQTSGNEIIEKKYRKEFDEPVPPLSIKSFYLTVHERSSSILQTGQSSWNEVYVDYDIKIISAKGILYP